MKREEKMKQEEETNEDGESKSWLPELSFTTVLSIVGIGFTAFDLFMRYTKIEYLIYLKSHKYRNLFKPHP